MDFGEKLFQFLSKSFQKKNANPLSVIYFDDVHLSLGVLAHSILEKNIELKKADDSQAHHLDAIYLPEYIDYFEDKNLNFRLYIYRTLFAAHVIKHQVWYHKVKEVSRWKELFEKIQHIEQSIQSELVNFSEIVKQVRIPITQKIQKILSERELNKREKKDNYELQNLFWLAWGGLLEKKTLVSLSQEFDQQTKSKKSQKNQAKVAFKIEYKNLENEKENLVTHSFEKLETVDQYQGGLKTTDGSDELNDHGDALKEIKLNSITRSSEETKSVFSANVSFDYQMAQTEGIKNNNLIQLHEWNYKDQKYLENWCQIYLHHSHELLLKPDLQNDFISQIKKKHGHFIKQEEMKIQSIFNILKWNKKQLDGSEVDIDHFINAQSDFKRGTHVKQNFYMNKNKSRREFAITILFDQSMSTDSWVQNKRVLDIELEAIGVFGLLTQNTNDRTLVLGFNSKTRHENNIYIYKKFDEPWPCFYARAPQIEPEGYTRLGPSVRYASEMLLKSSAKNKLLIIITDAKPTDYDGYEGKYGIEDVRQSIRECEQSGVFVKALAIDSVAQSHYSKMFGKKNFFVLNDISQLPNQLIKTYKESLNK